MSNSSQLSLEQRQAVEARLLRKIHPAARPSAAGPAGPVPLTSAQQAIWVACQLAPHEALYNIPVAFRLRGPLRVPLLRQSWDAVMRRHQALRTRVRLSDQRPFLEESLEAAPPLVLEEADGRPLETLLEREARVGFNLTQDWLVRGRLVRLTEDDHLLLVTVHHLIADNQSLAVLWRDLSRAYSGLLRGAAVDSIFSAPPPQFLNFASAHATRGESHEDTEFWRRRLESLSVERQTARSSFAGDWLPVTIPADVTAALKALARSEQTTLFMALLAAFGAVEHRHGAREEFAVGVPVTQRDFPGASEAFGMFIHTIPMPMSFASEPTFRWLLAQVKASAVACFGHARSAPARPCFQTVFQLIEDAGAALRLPEVAATELPMRTGSAKFDLTLTLCEKAGALSGSLEFSTAAFSAQAATRWIEHYVTFLRDVAAVPDKPVSTISLLSDDERRLVVTEWNRTETKYPREATIHSLFEEQVRLRPDAVALLFEERRISYSELDQQANALAESLGRKGVRRGDFVGVCLERSPRLIAALLGVLKAGAAYVPLDPDYPVERLEYMQRDAGVKAVLTDADEFWARPPGSPIAPPGAGAATDNAYVIYTSGSTGQPKGVVVPHRGVVRLVKETNYANFGHDEVFLQFAPATFDASTFEIWGALLNGATLAIYPPRFESLSQFGEVLRRFGVTTLWLTAGLFHQMVENNLEALSGVRQLLAGGDVLSAASVKTVLRALPRCRLINGYGPTENTTFSCCHTLPADWNGDSVPIGRPISNTRVYIVDKHFQPVGVGLPGELCVAGDGLASGYLNHAELTAEKFVPDPFSTEPGARLYRTGDLAQYLPDGTIEFFGRMDQQVKIRGFRVELGEVEEALRSCPGVAQAAVAAQADSTQTKHLAAYVVMRPGTIFDSAALRCSLREHLPAHLVPSRFSHLERLPLTANGKVDRRRLPAAAQERGVDAEALLKPRTDTEQRLAEIWRELLGLKELGVNQDFFDLGGHSLLAMRLQSRIFQSMGVALALRDIFEHPTVATLAERLGRSSGAAAQGPALIPRRPRRAVAASSGRSWN